MLTRTKIELRKLYLEALKVPANKWETYLKAMENYRIDWWKSNDPAILVRFQLNEPLLMVPLAKLQNALEQVLGRPVNRSEISFGNLSLKNEVYDIINSARS